MTQHPSIYRIKATMTILGLSRSTIDRMVKSGKLKKIQLGERSCGITADSITCLLAGVPMCS